jgi:hypothetical protein
MDVHGGFTSSRSQVCIVREATLPLLVALATAT